ncbi:hypothetical protein JKP88DRAFT_233452 [Tribonema minus]|uniref:Uncharacterized protein n=1 Tax=Tribonema minus TaxID=303371 RepID=A0A835ZF31_9STRA|nr:hypothetical protein JKP88DRAFT_233452 [Tribonema minus]
MLDASWSAGSVELSMGQCFVPLLYDYGELVWDASIRDFQVPTDLDVRLQKMITVIRSGDEKCESGVLCNANGGWGIQGEVCPWRCSDVSPTSTHAISCPSQHIRGHNATHTAQKRCLQRILRQHHVSIVRNEDASIFKVPGYRADTVIDPGRLHFSSAYRNKGIVLDTSVRAPTASSYLTGKTNASNTDGYAAGVGEDAKVKHHTGTLTSSWAFVPFVQESYGRLGKQTRLFVKELAMHSALISLARELAERVMAYTRGARMLGCVAAPVSKLLEHSAD